MQEEITLAVLTFGDFQVTGYSLMMALAALMGSLLTIGLNSKKLGSDKALSVVLSAFLGALLGGHIIYCLTNIGTLMADYESGLLLFLKPHFGGYTLYGALIGGMIGLLIYAQATKDSFLKLLDAVAPGAMLTVCVGRIAEYFTNQGLGGWIENESMMRFPFGIEFVYQMDDYSEWRVPVFLYEAAVALILMIVLIVLSRKALKEGRVAGVAITLLSTTQIFLEQLRQDDYVRFGFVRFTQLAALALILIVLAVRVARAVKKHGINLALILRCGLLVSTTLVVIFVEFALEKPQKMPFLIGSIILTAVLCVLWMIIVKCWQQGAIKPLPVITAAAIAIAAGASSVLLTKGLEWENDLIMAVMAVGLTIMSCATLSGDGE